MSANEHRALVPVMELTIGGKPVPAVEARDLHGALGVRKKFTDWVKQQIDRLRLLPERDYRAEVFPLEGKNPDGGRPEARYWLALDAAKHVAMMANTERGFEVREYFIECERRLHAAVPPRIEPPALDGTPIPPRPFHEWTLEEIRTKASVVQLYRHTVNRASAAWVMFQQGFPKPPPQLLPQWAHQSEADLEPRRARNVVVVTMPNGNGSAH